jgi:hypothetical protein
MIIPFEIWDQIFQFTTPKEQAFTISLVCHLFCDIATKLIHKNLNSICFVFGRENTFILSELISDGTTFDISKLTPDGTTFDINMSMATHLTQIKLYFLPSFVICVNKQSKCFQQFSKMCPPYQLRQILLNFLRNTNKNIIKNFILYGEYLTN